jgi:hypothetical protein
VCSSDLVVRNISATAKHLQLVTLLNSLETKPSRMIIWWELKIVGG